MPLELSVSSEDHGAAPVDYTVNSSTEPGVYEFEIVMELGTETYTDLYIDLTDQSGNVF